MGISREQALDCFRSDDLVGMGMEADAVRRRLHPEGVVSYAVVGGIDCGTDLDAASEASGDAVERGATGLRLRGGTGAGGIERLEELLGGIRRRFAANLAEIQIEGLTAAEVVGLSRECGLGLRETIARLQRAGLDSIAGDGVSLVDGDGLGDWVEVQRAAHGLGMRTVAAMVFGGGEALVQRVEFLRTVRDLQEETGGFAAFVPVAADAPGGRELDGVTAVERLKMLAVSRMFLDTIENVQAVGAAQGLKLLQTGLRFGANDAGPVGVDGSAASEEDVRRVIRDAGFVPVERDAAYRVMMLS